MTRFARVKSSISNTTRQPEEATPWSVLKADMGMKKRNVDVESLDNAFVNDDNHDHHEAIVNRVNENKLHNSCKGYSERNFKSDFDGNLTPLNSSKVSSESKKSELSLSSKKKRRHGQNTSLECKDEGHLQRDRSTMSDERREELQNLLRLKVERKGIGVGRKKSKKGDKHEHLEENKDDVNHKNCLNEGRDQSEKASEEIGEQENKGNGENNGLNSDAREKAVTKWESKLLHETAKKTSKKSRKRKGPKVDKSGHVIGPNEALFQGFRVMPEDAERLNELRIQLSRQKNLSSEEMEATLKAERRRAEKALQRVTKQVCFLCRKPGHVLQNCPLYEAKNVGNSCFKCGSETHSSRECTQKKFAFAKCFVCGELGHLARECEANPRGLYPKGGGCRMCGSVEHLKSDCPRKRRIDARQEQSAFFRDDGDIEGIGEEGMKEKENGTLPKKRRVVHF